MDTHALTSWNRLNVRENPMKEGRESRGGDGADEGGAVAAGASCTTEEELIPLETESEELRAKGIHLGPGTFRY